jgi:hypothetical protein
MVLSLVLSQQTKRWQRAQCAALPASHAEIVVNRLRNPKHDVSTAAISMR